MLLLAVSCTVPLDCADRLTDAAQSARERWPNAQSALDATVGAGCAWSWSHNRASVDGMGATMVLLSEKPGLDDAFDLDIDVFAGGRLDSPSLLFFDQGPGALDTWPLIGVGYHFDYEPCVRPDIPCFEDEDFFVHEAGYHRVLIGGGGMTLATSEDLTEGTVDPYGCEDIDDDDLRRHFNTVKHGRAWDLHVWLASDDGPATLAVTDPEERWTDAPSPITIDAAAFFVPDDAACACPQGGDTADTAAERPATCGEGVPTPEPVGGCAAVVVGPLVAVGLVGRRRRAR